MAKFANFISERNPNSVLIVDAMNLAFRWKHQNKLDFEYDYIRTVESLARSYDCEKIIIAADLGHSAMRKADFPEYKQNRKEKFKDQTEKEKEDMEKFFKEYERTLSSLAERFLVLRYKGVEADDLAAYIVKQKEVLGLGEIWLISSDRDWDLLVSDTVSRFSTVTRKETTLANWDEFSSLPHEYYVSLKVLTGDKGDNIDGIPGVGPKRAEELLKIYGSAFDVYDAIPIDSKYKYIQAINESGDLILNNYKLMDLLSYCEEAIEFAGHSTDKLQEDVMEYLNDSN